MTMNLPNILSNRQFKGIAITIAIVILVFVTINIFVVGGDLFIYTLNSSLNSPLAIIITISAFSVWRLMSAEKHNRFLWSGILIGWALWALAETIWAIYSILGQEVPYPSVADFFWIIGYIPMGIGLITRIRTMPTKPTRSQNMLIWWVSAITILITIFFIFIPIIQSFDPQRLIENILNFVYPLADLFLVIIVWRLFFTYEEGDYGFTWRLLTLGFMFMTVADFIFTYTTWQGLYYPDMTANVISRLGVDVPYTTSYLLWLAGIHALRILLMKKEEYPITSAGRVRLVRTYGHILIYTKNDDTVIDISPNFNRFFEDANVKGKSLAEALTISEQDGRVILEKLRKEGRVTDLPLQIRDRSGALQEIRLTGLAVNDHKNEYGGGNLLLRMRVADPTFDEALRRESRSMAKYLLEQSGSSDKAEIGQFLSDYYLAYIKSLLDLAFHQGGDVMSQALLDQLLETAKKHRWQMQFNSQTVLDSTKYSLGVLREALPVLLETAKRFVSDITDPAIVEARMQEISSRFSESVRRDIAIYEKAESEVGFSDHRSRRHL
jgi:hypothetical protein